MTIFILGLPFLFKGKARRKYVCISSFHKYNSTACLELNLDALSPSETSLFSVSEF